MWTIVWACMACVPFCAFFIFLLVSRFFDSNMFLVFGSSFQVFDFDFFEIFSSQFFVL